MDIVFEGQEGVFRALGVISAGLTDLREPIQAGLQVISNSILTRVAEGINPDILPESRRDRRVDASTPPLWDGGEMITAATATWDGVPGSTYELTQDGGSIGVESLFHGARRHQEGFGTDRLGRHFNEPPRPFMVFGTADGDKVVEIFETYIGGLLNSGAK